MCIVVNHVPRTPSWPSGVGQTSISITCEHDGSRLTSFEAICFHTDSGQVFLALIFLFANIYLYTIYPRLNMGLRHEYIYIDICMVIATEYHVPDSREISQEK